MDKVSVIIPTYNRSHTLKRAVESVLGQTFDNFELLIVDDGSEDDTKISGGFHTRQAHPVY
ncbi:MAG: glycosyltransferase [Lachnospiraceae bacterium]|nr:glycosyltransferase [Lachnospiraceae bacterium]